MWSLLREPISGLSHLAGALLGALGMLFLLVKGGRHGNVWHLIAFLVFGISLILLYSSSAMYHLLNVSEETEVILRRLDHMMIFVLIAGTYTPFCLIPLRGPWGWTILGVVWTLALAGLFFTFFWLDAPRWFSTGLYLFMGWLSLAILYPLLQTVSLRGMFWLVTGGFLYTVGAIIFATQYPDPFPEVFGFHEIWHFFVLAGSMSHFRSVSSLLIPKIPIP